MQKKTLKISGMHCAGCVQSVEKSIKKIDSVESVHVNLATETASVEVKDGHFPIEEIRQAVESAGYGFADEWTAAGFRIEGMHCAGCVNSVAGALEAIDGVRNVQVNLASEKAFLEYEKSSVGIEDLQKSVEGAGYKLIAEEEARTDKLAQKREREEKKLQIAWRNLVVAWIITAPVMVWMTLEMFLGVHLTGPLVMESLMTAGAAVVLFYPGLETLKSAWKSGRNLNPNMDVLIAIGTLASLSTGFLAVFNYLGWIVFPMHSFAGIAAMIMAFHLTGRYIETKSRGHASDAIMKLLTLEADSARVIRDGLEKEISVKELKPGDVMLIRPGEKIPTDGQVIDGAGSVNESMVTGESMPVRKEKSDEVIGGTINLEGSLRVKAVNVGEDTFLNRVVRLVEEAQGTRVPIQEYADRVTAIFVPVVLVLAIATFVFWAALPGVFAPVVEWADGIIPWVEPDMGLWSQAFYAALAVLVIACPCALGLATPTALMIGSGMGAENGVLIRRGEAIQRMQEVTQIVFDKTGTLTTGEPAVTDLEITGEMDEAEILKLIYAVENRSEHPISKAVAAYVSAKNIRLVEIDEFISHPGMGVSGRAAGKNIIVGNRRLMDRQGIEIPEQIADQKNRLEKEGKTVVFATVNKSVQALIAVADTIKPGTAEVLEQLKNAGYQTAMLTGDNQVVAEAIASQLGIGRVYAEVLPDQKAEVIRNLQEKGEIIAMVGDGVNDAPALTQADVGIAIGTGTDIAIESGSLVLIDGNINAVLKAVKLSRETFRKIRQNLFWAYFYNVVMIPIAVIGLMHPVLAEAAMAFSSVNVVVNSRRLQKKSISN